MHSALILTLNAGSSSFRFALFPFEDTASDTAHNNAVDAALVRGRIDGIRSEAPTRLTLSRWSLGASPEVEQDLDNVQDAVGALKLLLQWLDDAALLSRVRAVGHRVVHGGLHEDHCVLNADLRRQLEALTPLAPLHQPNDLAGIDAVAKLLPDRPQTACFDTVFHRSMPAVARKFALPASLRQPHLQRFGFHGLSYEYVSRHMQTRVPERAQLLIAHLGSGASLCAVRDGRSLDTTMGMTPLDGVPMGTRSGSLDPGALLWLLQQSGLTVDRLQALLYHESGLLGLSGISADMRRLRQSDTPAAQQAIDHFAYQCSKALGALSAALEAVQGVVFTGGIGEHDANLRAQIMNRCHWLDVQMDPAANERHDFCISTADSRVGCYVIPTDEEFVIAKTTRRLLSAQTAGPDQS